jgi:hypothetical protein
MRFEDVDLEGWTWTIGASETKTRSKYAIALGAKEIELLTGEEAKSKENLFSRYRKDRSSCHLVDPKT